MSRPNVIHAFPFPASPYAIPPQDFGNILFSAFFVGIFAFALAAERASFRQSCEAADKKARNDDEKHEKQAPPQEKEPHLITQSL